MSCYCSHESSLLHIPEVQHPCFSVSCPARQRITVSAPGEGAGNPCMLEPPQEGAIGCSPDQYQPIFTGAGDSSAVGGPHGGIDHCGMFTSHPTGAFLHIPETYAAIIASA